MGTILTALLSATYKASVDEDKYFKEMQHMRDTGKLKQAHKAADSVSIAQPQDMAFDHLLPFGSAVGATPGNGQRQGGRSSKKRKKGDIHDMPSLGGSGEAEERHEKRPQRSPNHNDVTKMKKALDKLKAQADLESSSDEREVRDVCEDVTHERTMYRSNNPLMPTRSGSHQRSELPQQQTDVKQPGGQVWPDSSICRGEAQGLSRHFCRCSVHGAHVPTQRCRPSP